MELNEAAKIANYLLMEQEKTNVPLCDLIMKNLKAEKSFQESYEILLNYVLKCELGEYTLIKHT